MNKIGCIETYSIEKTNYFQKIPNELIDTILSYLPFTHLRNAISIDQRFYSVTLTNLKNHYLIVKKILKSSAEEISDKYPEQIKECQALAKEIGLYSCSSINAFEKQLFEIEEKIISIFLEIDQKDCELFLELRKIPSVFYLLHHRKSLGKKIPLICKDLAEMRRLKKAVQIATKFNSLSQYYALKEILDCLNSSGEINKAKVIAESIEDEYHLSLFWGEVCQYLLDVDLDKVEKLTEQITNQEIKESVFVKICEKKAKNGDLKGCVRLASTLTSPLYKGRAFLHYLVKLCELKKFEEALVVIELLPKASNYPEEKNRVNALKFFFSYLEEEKHLEKAFNLVMKIESRRIQEDILTVSIQIFLEKNKIAYARKALSYFDLLSRKRRESLNRIKAKEESLNSEG